jgi:hypothetical protein
MRSSGGLDLNTDLVLLANLVCLLEGELSVSDSLDNTRGADEGSKLCSVLNHPALSWLLCQAKVASK